MSGVDRVRYPDLVGDCGQCSGEIEKLLAFKVPGSRAKDGYASLPFRRGWVLLRWQLSRIKLGIDARGASLSGRPPSHALRFSLLRRRPGGRTAGSP